MYIKFVDHRKILKTFIIGIIFYGLLLLFSKNEVKAFNEECIKNESEYWFEFTNLNANKQYRVRAQVTFSFSHTRSFDASSIFSVPHDGRYPDKIYFTPAINGIPKDYETLSFHLTDSSGINLEPTDPNCNITYTAGVSTIPVADFTYYPQLEASDNCIIKVSNGYPPLKFHIEVQNQKTGDKERIYDGVNGFGSSSKSEDVRNWSIFGDTGGGSVAYGVRVAYDQFGADDFKDAGTISYTCDISESTPVLPDGDQPPPEATCKDLCKGELIETGGEQIPEFNPNYIACCKCVCGNTDCECSDGGCSFTNNVWTEVGCITPTQEGITAAVMRIFVGVITGIAVIRFIQAGVMFNSDDPEKIAEAKSIFWSAIIALVAGGILPLIMNFIGIDILGIGEIFGIK